MLAKEREWKAKAMAAAQAAARKARGKKTKAGIISAVLKTMKPVKRLKKTNTNTATKRGGYVGALAKAGLQLFKRRK